MRRFGIYGYFLGTAIAQLMLSLTLAAFATQNDALDLKRLAWLMLALVTLPFVLGILNLVLKVVVDDYGAGQNRIEWITNLAMQAWFVLLYVAWRRTGFRVAVTLA
jgi:putative effector of murein hydrolase